jgi:putative endopeptidase
MLFSVSTISAQTTAVGVPSRTLSNAHQPVRFSLSNLDPKADPCLDFYRYACGGWIDANPLPGDEVFWDTTEFLQRWNESILQDLLNKVQGNEPNRSVVEREIGDYFAACMDEKQVEADRLKPIQPELDRIASIKDKHDFASELGRLHRILFRVANRISTSIYAPGSGEPLFEVSSLPDFDNTTTALAIVDQGGLGLPDREYYFRNDEESIQLRRLYTDHIRKTLELSGFTADAQAAARVLEIETELARASADPLRRRHFRDLDHKFSLQQLYDLVPAFFWEDYLIAVSAPGSPEYIVTSPDFFRGVDKLLRTVSLDDWKLYLRWHLLKDASSMLNRTLADEHFNFYGRILEGQLEQSPRPQRCLEATDRDLGDALGKVFVQQTFSTDDKSKVLEMVAGLQAAMDEDIAALTWMSAATKQQAIIKLRAREITVGYPEKWRDYSTMRIDRQGWAENAFRAGEFEHQRRIQRIGKPADRDDWYITTPTPDAYNSVQQNRVVVPAGFLGPPFFDRNIDDAVNFGGAGAGIGHELAHTFDDHGREYDAKGNLRNWWTQRDSNLFKERAECVSKQYSE